MPASHPLMRHFLATGILVLSLALFWEPVRALIQLSLNDERSAHVVVIPLITAALIWLQRKTIFSEKRYSLLPGLPLLLIGFGLGSMLTFSGTVWSASRLSTLASILVLVWIAGFMVCYGIGSFRAAAFPLLFLILMVPIPGFVIDGAVAGLQRASADTSAVLFKIAGIPMARTGFRFALPGVDIEITEECSSIRSCISLWITSLLAGYLVLDAAWKKLFLALLTIPIAVFKNSVRIVTISWLGIYWDPEFFHGELHRRGGLPFSLLALALMGILLLLLKHLPLKSVIASDKPSKPEQREGSLIGV